MAENIDIEDVSVTESQESESVATPAILAQLHTKNGTIIVPQINNATLNEPGIIRPDGVTTFVENGVLSSVGGSGGSNSTGIPPSNCLNLTIKKNGTSVSLKWQDPNDTIINKQTLSTWGKTIIVRKEDSFPENEEDGDVIVINTTRNAYFENAYVDTIDDASKDYKYKAFPVSLNGAVNLDSKNNFTEAIIYEFCINPNDSNPASRVTYPVGCTNENFTPAKMNFGDGFDYGDWEHAFFQPRPVMVKYDGTVDYELYKPDFRYKADGVTASDVANQNYGGNAMIAFPQVWFKFEMDGTLMHIYVANKQVDENYHCYTHINKNGVLLDEIFIMAFQPGNISSKLRSLSGISIMTSQTGTTEMTYAQNNGACWNIMDYGEFNMIAMLLTLMGKSTNVEAVFGKGRDSNNANATTGECIADGMFYGTQATGKLKIFGIENYYANYWKRCNGCVYNTTDGMKYKLCDYTTDGSTVIGYNTDGQGYLTHQTFSGSSGGYISQMRLTANGIFPTVASGSATTHYCDGLWWANGGFARVGGSYGRGSLGGAFCLRLDTAVSYSDGDVGGSLSCKPL